MENKDQKTAFVFSKSRTSRILLVVVLAVALLFALDLFTGDPVFLFHKPGQASPLSTSAPTTTPCVNQAINKGEVLEAVFIDVGQGDCILLRSPAGRTMLIDCGEAEQFDAVNAALKDMGVTNLDVVVATHAHSDHIGGMPQLLDRYPVGAFYQNSYYVDSPDYALLQQRLKELEIPTYTALATANACIPWDPDVTVRILAPYDVTYDSCNDSSVILHVQYGQSKLLLMGDVEQLGIKLALKALPDHYFHAAVLKAGHHGSKDSLSDKLLKAVLPSIAVISCGKDNVYGHPDPEALRMLTQYGCAIHRTDHEGTIHILLDGTGARVIE